MQDLERGRHDRSRGSQTRPDPAALRVAWPALITGGLALALYARTLAPGLTWAHNGADGGDLLAAALTHGVPHPSGYPTYQLLLASALKLAPGEPARVGNWLSAIGAALAVALLTDLACRMLAGQPWRKIAALASGLIFATSPALWSQAVITEVYTLNALAVVLVLWLVWRWREAALAGRRAWFWLTGAGLVFGLGLGNHLTLALMLPGLIVWMWPLRRSVLRQGRWQTRVMPLAGLALGLATYAYLPWTANRVPPVNWGNPSTQEGLAWLASGAIYRNMIFGLPLVHVPGRLGAWGGEASRQLGGGVWGALIALLGLWRLERIDRAWWWTTLLVALTYTAYAVGYNSADSSVYLIPAWAMASLWFAQGVAWIAHRIAAWRDQRWAIASLIVLAVGLPLIAAARHWSQMDLSRDRAAQDFVEAVLTTAAPSAVILVGSDEPTFALWYARYGLQQRSDLTPVNVHLYDYPWYQASLLRHHPVLAAVTSEETLPPLEDFVAAAAQRWPLYRAGALDGVVVGLREEPHGVLVRLGAP
jgi:4-amino-4-deoxy-L-arabinose transferase-like glycosyltransferase